MLGELDPMNDKEAARWEELVAAAKRYGARIESSRYGRGNANWYEAWGPRLGLNRAW
jgi:hypothetical protein